METLLCFFAHEVRNYLFLSFVKNCPPDVIEVVCKSLSRLQFVGSGSRHRNVLFVFFSITVGHVPMN
jgi:hypothetical protein